MPRSVVALFIALAVLALPIAARRLSKKRINVRTDQGTPAVVEIKSVSQKGYKGKDAQGRDKPWQNQDRGLAINSMKGKQKAVLLAAFDGHGEGGQIVADKLKKKFSVWWKTVRAADDDSKLKKGIKNILVRLNKDAKVFAPDGGSTAAVAIVRNGKVLAANVGDSRIVLGTRTASGLVSVPVTKDQTPCFENKLQEEDERMKKLYPDCYYGVERWSERARGWFFQPLEPSTLCQVLSGDDIVRLVTGSGAGGARFTRSIGDSSLGKCAPPDPVFSQHTLTEEDEYLLVASDGLWEFVSNQDAMRMVEWNKGNTKTALEQLLTASTGLWNQNEDGQYIDDTTIVLAKLGPGGPPIRRMHASRGVGKNKKNKVGGPKGISVRL